MKKKIILAFFILITLIALGACSAKNQSSDYDDLIGPWQLDSRYVNGESQDIKWTILDFKKDKTLDIYEYTKEIEKSAFRKDVAIPDMSEFTLISNSNVEVNGDSISYQYNGSDVNARYTVDLNGYKAHFYIDNADENIIHEIYKSADKSKRP